MKMSICTRELKVLRGYGNWKLLEIPSNIKADSAAETLPITPRFTTVPRSQRHEFWKIRGFRLADTVGGQGTTLCHFFWAGIEQKSIQVILWHDGQVISCLRGRHLSINQSSDHVEIRDRLAANSEADEFR